MSQEDKDIFGKTLAIHILLGVVKKCQVQGYGLILFDLH